MSELLFLLLPLAFYSGWRASGKSLKPPPPGKRQLSDNFVKGVNFLLNEEPDKALDVFLNRPEIDEYTAETYLLLGNLFRNRGEVDRALSVHQNLIGRASLNRAQKSATMLALGQDFLAAGMMDRAEQIFTELLQGDNVEEARDALRNIYEQTQEWSKAIEVTEVGELSKNSQLASIVANYYCELAEAELNTGHIQNASEELAKATQHFPESPRIKVITAKIYSLQQKHLQACELYLSAISEAPRLLGSVYQSMVDSYSDAGILNRLQDELFSAFTYSGDIKVLEYVLRLAIDQGPNDKVKRQLPEIMQNKLLNARTIEGATSLFCSTDATDKTTALSLIHTALSNHLSSQPGYLCNHCGYKLHDFLWRCPACNQWDEVVDV